MGCLHTDVSCGIKINLSRAELILPHHTCTKPTLLIVFYIINHGNDIIVFPEAQNTFHLVISTSFPLPTASPPLCLSCSLYKPSILLALPLKYNCNEITSHHVHCYLLGPSFISFQLNCFNTRDLFNLPPPLPPSKCSPHSS